MIEMSHYGGKEWYNTVCRVETVVIRNLHIVESVQLNSKLGTYDASSISNSYETLSHPSCLVRIYMFGVGARFCVFVSIAFVPCCVMNGNFDEDDLTAYSPTGID